MSDLEFLGFANDVSTLDPIMYQYFRQLLQKRTVILTIISLLTYFNAIINLRKESFDIKYIKIKEFENSYEKFSNDSLFCLISFIPKQILFSFSFNFSKVFFCSFLAIISFTSLI